MTANQAQLSWRTQLIAEFNQPYMKKLRQFLAQEKQKGKQIYPQETEYYRALQLTPFNQVKVIILGQDPYHGGQAHGLSFSVKKGVPLPPSLLNIYKELYQDLGITPVAHGNLEAWSVQGVLLLNSVLTVEHQKPASHHGYGWERFTDVIIQKLNQNRRGLVFILWGKYAQQKGQLIDRTKHYVIQSVHPSPLSAFRGFFGSNPFSRSNQYLTKINKSAIQWNLSEKF